MTDSMDAPIKITRTVKIPDLLKIERYRRLPELGPRILFFSGGTALRSLSQQLINYTYNSIHLVTPFDYGGSSRKLRDAFNMISVGDLRNRLMALADQSVKGNPLIYRLFVYRLSSNEENAVLAQRLERMASGDDPLIAVIPQPMRDIICYHLKHFLQHMPPDFDLKGANIGNLILAGGYLSSNASIDAVIYIFSRLVEARGIVKPLLDELLHLGAELEDGTLLIGQHLLTGKEVPQITCPVKRIFITNSLDNPEPVHARINGDIQRLIREADLICYPMGSFYSSIVANLIPDGVEEAVAANICPNVYIPNTGPDPEQNGMDMAQAVETLIRYLKKDTPGIDNRDLLNYIIIDTRNARYPYPIDHDRIRDLGVEIIDTKLVTHGTFPYIDSACLIEVLLSLT